MTIVEHRMAYEKANKLLELMKSYGWSKGDIAMQKIAVADLKAVLKAAELREKELWG